MSARALAAGNIVDIARRLGAANLKRAGAVEYAGPCPKCGGRDRFSVNAARQVWNCRGCGLGGDDIALVRHVLGCSYAEALAFLGDERVAVPNTAARKAAEPPRRQERVAPTTERQVDEIVAGMVPMARTPGQRYLQKEREIDVQPIADVLERVDAVGWHSGVYFNEPGHELHGRRLGCIVGIMTDARTAETTGAISRTYLNPDGRKVGKAKTLGSPAGIIRLSTDDDVNSGLFLAEGLETALAAMAIGLRPMWSTGSTALMKSFPPLAGIECITLIADNDQNGAGLNAANACATAWREAGKEARILMSRGLGDLNDASRGAA